VTWISYVVPWGAIRVVVDGAEVARVGYQKPASITLAVGRHDVRLQTGTGRYTTHELSVDIVADRSVELFGGHGRLPAGAIEYRDMKAWATENRIWLANEPIAPPPGPTVIPADSHLSHSMHSAWWYGRRRRIPLFAAAVLLWSVAAVRTPHVWSRIIPVVLILGAVYRSYVCWTDPLPSGYAERLQNRPPFGKKLWHKLAIAFLASFALLVVTVSVWPAK
jgi:hypothetical protein